MVSHTTTGEWQSFETRMRHRRAERLVLRADVAIEAGCLDDARQCIEEARGLLPGLASIPRLEQLLASAEQRPIVVETASANAGNRRVPRALAAAAASMVLAGTLRATWHAEADPAVPAPLAVRQLSLDIPVSLPAPHPPVTLIAPQVRQATPDPSTFAPPERASVVAAPEVPLASAGGPLPITTTAPPPELTGNPSPLPAPAPPPAPVAAPTLAINAAGPNLPAPTVEPVSLANDVGQEHLVRAVLNRYAAAYTDLDADAAQRVWPGVNRTALSRAFEGLSAQRVTLGDCRIDIAGETARAQCAGSATWSPKVGSGNRTEARDWTFQLTRAGEGWQIVSARVQNK